MIGVPGTAHRLFGALREDGISVILISQGSSEHSICCAIPGRRGGARRARRGRGVRSRDQGRPDPEHRGRHGARASSPWSATAWRACPASRARCSTRSAPRASTCTRSRRARPSATSRWSSTRRTRRARCAPCIRASICRRTRSRSASSARAPSAARCSSRSRAESARLRDEFKLDLRVRGIMSSKKMLLAEQGHPDRRLEGGARREQDTQRTSRSSSTTCTSITCRTRSSSTARPTKASRSITPSGSTAGIHVVTPNKKANSGPLATTNR